MRKSENPQLPKRKNRASKQHIKKWGEYHAALFRLSADLEAVIKEEEVYHCVVEGLHDTLGYDFVAVFRHDPKTGNRDLVASVGFTDPVTPMGPGEGLSERPLLDGKLHLIRIKSEPGISSGIMYPAGKKMPEESVAFRPDHIEK